jgi:hypothetical protein
LFQPITVYLDDHLAGAQMALEVLRTMQEQHDHPRFRDFAASLVPAIAEDDATLRSIIESFGTTPSRTKQAGGWLLEKASRLKLGHAGSLDFSLFESLELLCLGILGKQSLWKALEACAPSEPRLSHWDFRDLICRAQQQFDRVEHERIALARVVLRDTSSFKPKA